MIRTLRLMLLAFFRGVAMGWQNAAEVLFAETNLAFLRRMAKREREVVADARVEAERHAAEERAAGRQNVWPSAMPKGVN